MEALEERVVLREERVVDEAEFNRISDARDGLIPASFEAVYGHAWLPESGATRKATDGSVAIPVNRIGRRR